MRFATSKSAFLSHAGWYFVRLSWARILSSPATAPHALAHARLRRRYSSQFPEPEPRARWERAAAFLFDDVLVLVDMECWRLGAPGASFIPDVSQGSIPDALQLPSVLFRLAVHAVFGFRIVGREAHAPQVDMRIVDNYGSFIVFGFHREKRLTNRYRECGLSSVLSAGLCPPRGCPRRWACG